MHSDWIAASTCAYETQFKHRISNEIQNILAITEHASGRYNYNCCEIQRKLHVWKARFFQIFFSAKKA